MLFNRDVDQLEGLRARFHGFPGGPAPGGVQFMALEVQLLSMEAG